MGKNISNSDKFNLETHSMKSLSLLFVCCSWVKVGAQIWSNPITGASVNLEHPYHSGESFSNLISVSGIVRGSGVDATLNTDNRYLVRHVNSTSLDINDYFEFTIAANSGSTPGVNFASFNFTSQISNTGPPNFELREGSNVISSFSQTTNTTKAISIDLSSYFHITTSITFRLYFWGATSDLGTFSINDFSFNGQALPIQLSSFKVDLKNDKPLITWTTYSETNNDHYIIQRSLDGQSFTDLATYNGIGKGASDHELSYAHIDQTPYPGKNYYRLKQVDLDGTSSVFPIRSVFVPSRLIKVYPTYVKNELKMELPYKDTWRWSITDLSGHSCDEGYATSSGGIAILALNHLSNGFYVITLSSLEDKKSFKIIKL